MRETEYGAIEEGDSGGCPLPLLTNKIFQKIPLHHLCAEQAVQQQEPRFHRKNDKAELFR